MVPEPAGAGAPTRGRRRAGDAHDVDQMDSARSIYRDGLRTCVRTNATAYGFSVLATCVFGMAQVAESASAGRVFGFAAGAGVAFIAVEAAVSNLFRDHVRGDRSDVVFLGTAFNLGSVLTALLVGWLLTLTGAPFLIWVGAPFAATLTYLLVGGIEMTLARRLARRQETEANGGDA